MASKTQRYEAAVKLMNEKVVQYHNINTGLFKFHHFIMNKFGADWKYYTIRRINTKEVLETYKNRSIQEVNAIKIYLPKQENPRKTGFFISLPFIRDEYNLRRNVFFSEKIILEQSEKYITVPETIYLKAIENAKNDLKVYYEDQGHIVYTSDFKLKDFYKEKIIYKIEQEGTNPLENYP